MHYDKFGSRFIRGPVDPNYPNLPGPIIGFDNRLLNLGTTQTSGIDVSLAWTAPRVDWGLISVALQATYVMQWDTQFDGVVFVSQVGTDAYGPAIPRWRSQLTLNWNNGPWGATLAQTYTAGYTDFAPGPSGEPHEVGAFAPWDLQGTYSGFRGWQLVAGIRNLFDSDPPVSNHAILLPVRLQPADCEPARAAVLSACNVFLALDTITKGPRGGGPRIAISAQRVDGAAAAATCEAPATSLWCNL